MTVKRLQRTPVYDLHEVAAELFRALRDSPANRQHRPFSPGEAEQVWESVRGTFPGITNDRLQQALDLLPTQD